MSNLTQDTYHVTTNAVRKADLYNSGSSKGQIININLPRAAKVYLISM